MTQTNQQAPVEMAAPRIAPEGPYASAATLAPPRPQWWEGLRKIAMRRGTLVLFDQAMVSGTSLLTTILIGRACGAAELGIYALGSTVIIFSSVVHDSLVSSPFTVLGNRHDPPRRAAFATAMLRLHVWLTAAMMLLLAGASALLGWSAAASSWGLLAAVLCLAIPGTLLREFSRRLAFAHLNVPLALGVDAFTTALQLGVLGVLVLGGHLSSTAGLLAIGATWGLAGLVGLAAQRTSFARRAPEARRDIQEGLRFGSWVVAARVVAIINLQIIYWLLALRMDEAATGVFAACLSITLLANPVLLGYGSILGPQAAVAFAQERHAGLRYVVRRALLVLCGLMMAICTVTAVGGDLLMALIFGNGQYAGNGLTIAVLALHVFVGAISVCLYHGLCTLRRTDVNFGAGVVSLVVTGLAAFTLLPLMGLVGAALALLIGNVASTALMAVVFLHLAWRDG